MTLWQKIKDSTTIDESVEQVIKDASTLPKMALLLRYYKAAGWGLLTVGLVVGFALGRI